MYGRQQMQRDPFLEDREMKSVWSFLAATAVFCTCIQADSVTQVTFEDYGPNSAYRWMDAADQVYGESFRSTYSYANAEVVVTHNARGYALQGHFEARGLKPNFAYQFKLLGEPGSETNELIGLAGRWWEQEWTGTGWTTGWNLNNKGDGSSPNPNDLVYFDRRDIPDATSPTGLHYKYSGYRVFDYFITDENGNASFDFIVDACYHVLWKTSQRSPGALDGPEVEHTWNVDPGLNSQYETDYGPATVGIFGEWERLGEDGVGLLPGPYQCDLLLTEESFHGSGLQGWWAHAMVGTTEFTILEPFECPEYPAGDINRDCQVDLEDLALLALSWMECNREPSHTCWQ